MANIDERILTKYRAFVSAHFKDLISSENSRNQFLYIDFIYLLFK